MPFLTAMGHVRDAAGMHDAQAPLAGPEQFYPGWSRIGMPVGSGSPSSLELHVPSGT